MSSHKKALDLAVTSKESNQSRMEVIHFLAALSY